MASNLLLVSSSLFGDASQSRTIAQDFVDRWTRTHPGTKLVHRALSAGSIPHLTLATFKAASTPADKRNAAESETAALADALIGELEAADVIVIAAPMYNLSIPSTLKAWIDHVARRGRTFRYSENGPEGLLKGKRVFVLVARGGVYSKGAPAAAFDFQEPYLRTALGFLGLTDVTFVYLEGLAMGPEAANTNRGKALAEIDRLTGGAVAAAAD
jgi:FMN-dependent NADH-azoreductase